MTTIPYNTSGDHFIPGPLYSDFDPNSEMAIKMLNAKRVNDDTFWESMREVIAHDCDTLPMDRFKVWASVLTIPIMSTTKYAQYIKIALQAAFDNPVYHETLKEPMIGLDQRDFGHFAMFTDYPTTMNRIQALSHLLISGFDFNKIREMDKIVEIGAGIGDMADIIYKLGFTGEYIIYDFPELGRIQKWYHDELGHNKILHTDDINDLEDADLVIGTWSLTEMPFDLREIIVDKLKSSKNWLLTYSNEIFGYNNDSYIKDVFIPKIGAEETSRFIQIPWANWDGGSSYLIINQK